MLITTHAAVGFTIGALVSDPYIAIPLALASHYLLDGLPHFEVSTFRKPGEKKLKPKNLFELIFVLTDAGLAFAFLAFFHIYFSPSAFWGVIAGVAPDVLDNVFLWSPYLHRIPVFRELHSFHKNFHHTARNREVAVGVLTQILIIALCVLILLRGI